jgi:glutamate racemase
MSNTNPIGIFDSGIGGLTVANALQQRLPNESLIYFGDTAHLPYGDKSAMSIQAYSLKIADFLLSQNCKAIVIACNTASSHAYEVVRAAIAANIPVINVIDPVVNFVVHNEKSHSVGVIATKGTIQSGVYERKLLQAKPSLHVASLATPLLVPMIEEGFYNNSISHTVIHAYLSSPELQNIDTLILGCTHYPLIHNEMADYYKGAVQIIDSADIVAQHTQKVLEEAGLLKANDEAISHHFYVSDFTKSFEQSARYFFKGQIKLELYDLWK